MTMSLMCVSICQNIMWIMHEGIKSRLFERGGDDAIVLARSILTEVHNALRYRWQRRSQGLGLGMRSRLCFYLFLGCFGVFFSYFENNVGRLNIFLINTLSCSMIFVLINV